MAERSTTFLIGIDGDAGSIKDLVASVKSDLVKAVRDLQSASDKVKLFGDTEQQVKDAKDAFNVAQAAVAHFTDEVNKAKAAGGGVGDDLAKSLKDAQTAATAAEKAYAKSQTTLAKLSTQLTKAGVDTRNLATEQIRLATALKQASTAQEVAAAKSVLGVKTLSDVQPQIDKISAAYRTLANSGTLTNSQLAAAWIKQQKAIADLRGEVTGLSNTLATFRGPATAVALAVAGVGAAVASVVGKFNAYNDAVLKGSTVTNLTKDQLDKLAEGARDVAREFGEDTQAAIQAVFTLIRSGVPPDNALTALRDAAQAAQGGLADLGTTVQLGATILQAYGKTADELPKIYDQITFAAHQGGSSIEELSGSIGELLPVARAAHVPFDELLAAITTLRKAGLDSSTAVTVLRRFLTTLSDPDTIKKLGEMGIAVNGLAGTIEQIGEKNFDLTALKDLGDARSIAGISALSTGYQTFATVLTGVRTEADGAAAAASKIVDQTQGDKVRKLGTSFEQLEQDIGKSHTGLIGFAVDVTDTLDSFIKKSDAASASVDRYVGKTPNILLFFRAFADSLGIVLKPLVAIVPAQDAAAASLAALTVAASASAKTVSASISSLISSANAILDASKRKADDLRNVLGTIATDLAGDITAVQAQQAAALKSIDDVSKAQIAALGTQALSQQQLEQQTVAITVQAAADRLKVIQDASTQVLAAFDAEAKTRLAKAQGNATEVANVERQLAGERKALIGSIVDAYQKQVNDLTAIEAGYIQKIKSIDQERVDFNRDIQSKIDAIRAQGLGALAVYQQKVTDIENLLAAAHQANLAGEFKIAEDYTKQAVGLIGGIGQAVTEGGKEVVDAQRAQTTQVGLLERAQEIYNKSLDQTAKSANDGKNATAEQLKVAQEGLRDASSLYDTLSDKFKKGLDLKIQTDVEDAQNSIALLESYIQDVNRVMHVELDLKAAKASIDEISTDLQHGITAGAEQGAKDITALLADVGKTLPELKLKTDEATGQVKTLGTQIDALSDKKVSIAASIDDVQAKKEIDTLTKDRDMTVTVHVKAVGDVNALGGAGGVDAGGGVEAGDPGLGLAGGGLVQGFARGGPVFSGRKVPGSGSGDTYPANLETGSFVLRKAATNFYGDGLLGRLARGFAAVQRFAYGGLANPVDQYNSSQYYGSSDSNQLSSDTGIGIPDPDLPDDKAKRIALIRTYMANVVPAARQWDGAYWERGITNMFHEWDTYQQRPTDLNEKAVLDQARAVGLNLGITRGLKVGFDVDGKSWHKTRNVASSDFNLASLGNVYEFYGKGGAAGGKDTVPAMLTPGEWVVKPQAVANVGADFMRAVNSMRVPREALARMLTPPRVHRFAEGGQVPGSASASMSAGAVRERQMDTTNTTFNLNGIGIAEVYSEANLVRHFVPAWDRIQRRRSKRSN